jgi:hypothetical protein
MNYRLKERQRSIQRGISFIAELARHESCLSCLGSGLLYFCRSLANNAADPQLRRQAATLGRIGFLQWKSEAGAMPEKPDASSIIEYVRVYGAVESLGLRDSRVKARLARASKAWSAVDYFGFNPRAEPPPGDVPEACECGTPNDRGKRVCANRSCRSRLARMTRYRMFCLTLTSAYCGERYGVPLGASYRDTLRWLPLIRPYRFSARRRHTDFYDASYAVTHVVYTMNDYGRFILSPWWLPWEYEFLRTYLETAMAMNDPDMTGEFLDTLRAFGVGDDDPQVRRGFDFLIDMQNADGSWGDWDFETLYTGFHATWAAIDGLRQFAWTGPNLLYPDLLPSLERWARVRY